MTFFKKHVIMNSKEDKKERRIKMSNYNTTRKELIRALVQVYNYDIEDLKTLDTEEIADILEGLETVEFDWFPNGLEEDAGDEEWF